MASLTLPSKLNPSSSSLFLDNNQSSLIIYKRSIKIKKTHSPVARLFGPSIFEASKLKVLFLGVDEKKHPGNLPRTYTLTHSDITSKLTLAISQNINNSQLQGWSNKVYRDEVVAEWRKVKGNMSLHVHCHISGGHFFLDLFARLRFFIFTKELPLVLKAFAHGDGNLLNNYPDLQEALVWVFFHSTIPEYNRVECWGPLSEAGGSSSRRGPTTPLSKIPRPCLEDCSCCFPTITSIPWSEDPTNGQVNDDGTNQGLGQQIR
ncbi:non-yellowing 1 [Artemisia annua]|uniref:Non-yellowing 1 n=1 Tax=Artemisia annua TaxID=35608 RepID=A0A2U1PWY7_ARTAN|nr:non-yellowing 1 [Artemisia annua]